MKIQVLSFVLALGFSPLIFSQNISDIDHKIEHHGIQGKIAVPYISSSFLDGIDDFFSKLTANFGFSMSFPVERITPYNKTSERILFSSLVWGIGYFLLEKADDRFSSSPGIYVDMHINFPVFILPLFGFGGKTEESTYYYLIAQTGIRLVHRFCFFDFDIQPFIGLSFMEVGARFLEGSINDRTLWAFGILAAYQIFGLEYSYQISQNSSAGDTRKIIHRIALLYHY